MSIESLKQYRVLLIDSAQQVHSSMIKKLYRVGFHPQNVYCVTCFDDAVKLFHKQDFHFVFCADILSDTNAFVVIEKFQQMQKSAKFILVCSSFHEDHLSQSLLYNFDGVITRPLQVESIINTLNACMKHETAFHDEVVDQQNFEEILRKLQKSPMNFYYLEKIGHFYKENFNEMTYLSFVDSFLGIYGTHDSFLRDGIHLSIKTKQIHKLKRFYDCDRKKIFKKSETNQYVLASLFIAFKYFLQSNDVENALIWPKQLLFFSERIMTTRLGGHELQEMILSEVETMQSDLKRKQLLSCLSAYIENVKNESVEPFLMR